jgi:tetratricopeptide (TPR) repeat protein
MFVQIFCALSFAFLMSAGPAGELCAVHPCVDRIKPTGHQNYPAPPAYTIAFNESTHIPGGNSASGFRSALVESAPAYRNEEKKDTGYVLRKVEEWRTATLLHNPGEADKSAREIGGWDEEDLKIVVDFITELASQSVKSVRRTISKTPIRNRLKLTALEVKQGDLNRVLMQGALLHTDIALLGLETGRYLDPREQIWIYLDGRATARHKTVNWKYARSLIDSVDLSRLQDNMVLQWYVATTACLQSRRLLPYAKENLEGMLELFPSDSKILFYAGAQHETWALPINQDVQLPWGGDVYYGSKKSELKKAQDFFKKALKINPDFAEASLHFGRVLLLLGNPNRAYVELHKADAKIDDPQLSYYISLYLGRTLAALSSHDEAREQYERAAKLYPTAQSPLLALSQLAQIDDDAESAFAAVQQVFELPRRNVREDDPWWIYDLSHVRNAEALLEEMYKKFEELPR